MKEKTKSFLVLLVILGLFVLSSYLVRTNIDFFRDLIGSSPLSVLIYILITIIAIVIAPVTMMPLIPVASNIYGWFYAGLITLFGWTLGSFIVFFICRKYGVRLIKKLVPLKEIYSFESKIPKENLFLDIVLLRAIVPVDVLSYALGLFSRVNFRIYALATFIGLIPFTFVFSYLGTVPVMYQILGFIIIVVIIALIHFARELKVSKR